MKRITKIFAAALMSMTVATAFVSAPADLSPVSTVSFAASKELPAVTGIRYYYKNTGSTVVTWDKVDNAYCYVINTYNSSTRKMSKYKTMKKNSVSLPKNYEGNVEIIAYSKVKKKNKKLAAGSFELSMEPDTYSVFNAVTAPEKGTSANEFYSYPLTVITGNYGLKATGSDLKKILASQSGDPLEKVQSTLRTYFRQQNSSHTVSTTSNPAAGTIAKELEKGNFVIYYDETSDEINVIYGYEMTEGALGKYDYMFDLYSGSGYGAEVLEREDRLDTKALIVK